MSLAPGWNVFELDNVTVRPTKRNGEAGRADGDEFGVVFAIQDGAYPFAGSRRRHAHRAAAATPLFDDVGIHDIVGEAGMSTRTFYKFFSGKVDLVSVLATDRAEMFLVEMEKIAGEAKNSLEAIDKMLRFYLERLPVVVLELERAAGSA